MDILNSWRLFKENKIIFALCLLCSISFGSYLNFSATPLYVSEAQVFVSTPMAASDAGALLSGSSFSQQRVKSYAELINSSLILDPVIQSLGLQVTAKELSKSVSAKAPADTVLLNISAQDSNPQRAADIANAVAIQFSTSVANIEGATLSFAGNLVTVSIAKKAIPADSPASPKKAVNLVLAAMIGILLGFGLAQIKKIMNLTVTGIDDLLGIPLLAAIEFDYEAKEKPLISQLGKYASRTESFRTLRTGIRYIAPSVPSKVIAITSAVPEEGKTTASLNFGISLAQSNCKTVIIEADLRRAQFSNYMAGLNSNEGLSYLLQRKTKLQSSLVMKNAVKIDNGKLWVIPCGKIPSNPAELLGSERFDELLKLLQKTFDYVIIDCPPILPVTDAAIIATKSDGVILIVHTAKTKKSELVGARASIESVSGKLFGIVLNKIPQKSSRDYGYRYGYRSYFGQQYTSENGLVYAPSSNELARLEREDFFNSMNKKKGRA
jgi:succinoglycan biosynthesis transport protein ExoP